MGSGGRFPEMDDMDVLFAVSKLAHEYMGVEISVEENSGENDMYRAMGYGSRMTCVLSFNGNAYRREFMATPDMTVYREMLYILMSVFGGEGWHDRGFGDAYCDDDDLLFFEMLKSQQADVIRSALYGYIFDDDGFSEEGSRIKLDILGRFECGGGC